MVEHFHGKEEVIGSIPIVGSKFVCHNLRIKTTSILYTYTYMKNFKNKKLIMPVVGNLAESIWKTSWAYIPTIIDTVREPFLILNQDLCVLAANEAFYKAFRVTPEDTENKFIYELGDGQWDTPTLRKLLKNVLVEDTFFNGYEVTHYFPDVGRRVMLLNGRRIHQNGLDKSSLPVPMLLLAIEDITEITLIANRMASQTVEYETKIAELRSRVK
jgi:PAS domain-containing protein